MLRKLTANLLRNLKKRLFAQYRDTAVLGLRYRYRVMVSSTAVSVSVFNTAANPEFNTAPHSTVSVCLHYSVRNWLFLGIHDLVVDMAR